MRTLKSLITKKNISKVNAVKFTKNDMFQSGNIVTIQDTDENIEHDCIVVLNEDSRCEFIKTSYSDDIGYLMTCQINAKSPAWWRIGSFLKKFPIHKTYDNILITNIRKSDIDVTKIVKEQDLVSIFDKCDLIYDYCK